MIRYRGLRTGREINDFTYVMVKGRKSHKTRNALEEIEKDPPGDRPANPRRRINFRKARILNKKNKIVSEPDLLNRQEKKYAISEKLGLSRWNVDLLRSPITASNQGKYKMKIRI